MFSINLKINFEEVREAGGEFGGKEQGTFYCLFNILWIDREVSNYMVFFNPIIISKVGEHYHKPH